MFLQDSLGGQVRLKAPMGVSYSVDALPHFKGNMRVPC